MSESILVPSTQNSDKTRAFSNFYAYYQDIILILTSLKLSILYQFQKSVLILGNLYSRDLFCIHACIEQHQQIKE